MTVPHLSLLLGQSRLYVSASAQFLRFFYLGASERWLQRLKSREPGLGVMWSLLEHAGDLLKP